MAWLKQIEAVSASFEAVQDEALIIPVFQQDALPESLKKLDEANQHLLSKSISGEFFKAKGKSVVTLVALQDSLRYIILTGLGKKESMGAEDLRKAIGLAVKEVLRLKVKSATVLDTFSSAMSLKIAKVARYTAFAATVASYSFTVYNREKRDTETAFEKMTVLIDGNMEQWKSGITVGQAIGEGNCLARDLGNHPGNVATPSFLAETARSFSTDPKMQVQVFNRKEIEKLGMGGLGGVSAGSKEEPRFILLNYQGGKKNDKPVALVGKGLTFDSGGISLKPGAGMDEMKFDMLGGAAVLGIMKAVSLLQPELNVVAAVPATDNMPDGGSLRPGDIITAYNGKTIEVLNTDAEGRLILADGLAYLSDVYKPRMMFDFATLTGAVLVALGHEATGIMGNDEELIGKIRKSADQCGERVWPLPIYPEFTEAIKSDIADVKNIGPARLAGSATAAAFLQEFVGEHIPWVHFDIAGTADMDKETPLQPKGPSGVGIALVMEYLLDSL